MVEPPLTQELKNLVDCLTVIPSSKRIESVVVETEIEYVEEEGKTTQSTV